MQIPLGSRLDHSFSLIQSQECVFCCYWTPGVYNTLSFANCKTGFVWYVIMTCFDSIDFTWNILIIENSIKLRTKVQLITSSNFIICSMKNCPVIGPGVMQGVQGVECPVFLCSCRFGNGCYQAWKLSGRWLIGHNWNLVSPVLSRYQVTGQRQC